MFGVNFSAFENWRSSVNFKEVSCMCAREFGLHRRAISSVIRFPNDFIALLQVIELIISLLGEIPLSLEFSFFLDIEKMQPFQKFLGNSFP